MLLFQIKKLLIWLKNSYQNLYLHLKKYDYGQWKVIILLSNQFQEDDT